MAGFLSALGWAAPVLAGASNVQQDYQNQKQLAANEQGFGNMVNQLGPDYDWAKQWYKQAGPGASHDIAAAMGGKLGDIFRQQAMAGKLAGIWDDPTKSPEQKLSEAAAIDPEYGKYFGELAVNQAKLGTGFKPSQKLGDFLDLQGISRDQWDSMKPEEKKALMPSFRDFVTKTSAAGGDKSPFTPEELKAMSDADPRFGQIARDNPVLATTMGRDKYLQWVASQEKPTPAERATMQQQQIAMAGLSDLKSVGDIVLPDAPPGGSKAAAVARGYRWWLAETGDPMMGAFTQTQTAIISHMRALANTGRANQRELEIASNALDNAGSKGQLDNAVFLAQRALQRAYEIVKNNGMVVVGQGKDSKILTPAELAAMGGGIGATSSGVDFGSGESAPAAPPDYSTYPGETPGGEDSRSDDDFIGGASR